MITFYFLSFYSFHFALYSIPPHFINYQSSYRHRTLLSFPVILISSYLSYPSCHSLSFLLFNLFPPLFRFLFYIHSFLSFLPLFSHPLSFSLSFPSSLPTHLFFITFSSLFLFLSFIPFLFILSFISHFVLHPIPFDHHSKSLLSLSLLLHITL